MTLMTLFFAFLWFLIIYHHVLFPLIMRQVRPVEINPARFSKELGELEEITILIPAYNEADVIADKVRNIAALDYPREKLKVIIACDGCKDNTADVARATAAEWLNRNVNLRIIEFRNNHGKVAVLNQLIPEIRSEIIALSDASALISIDALKIANEHFANPKVGVVAATYALLNPGSEGEKRYWNYQINIKRGEAALGSPIGVHGALYFFKRSLFRTMPADTINDDFILPMEIVSRGYEALYDTNLVALELEQASTTMDKSRRVRIASGNLQQVMRLPGLLSPHLGGTAWAYLSGKVLRAFMPSILLFQWLITGYLAMSSIAWLGFFIAQLLTIIAAIASLYLPSGTLPDNKFLKPLSMGFYLINGYISGLIGTFRYLFRLDKHHWRSVSKH